MLRSTGKLGLWLICQRGRNSAGCCWNSKALTWSHWFVVHLNPDVASHSRTTPLNYDFFLKKKRDFQWGFGLRTTLRLLLCISITVSGDDDVEHDVNPCENYIFHTRAVNWNWRAVVQIWAKDLSWDKQQHLAVVWMWLILFIHFKEMSVLHFPVLTRQP